MTMQGNRVSHTHAMTIDANAETIFPLLCPVRESDWIDGWSSEVIYSESGVAELGCVFLTDLGGRGTETWIVTRFEPGSAIDFSRTAGASRACLLEVRLTPTNDGQTALHWVYTHTGIDAAGRDWVDRYPAARFASDMEMMTKRLRHYLQTGEKLGGTHAHH